MKHYITSDPTTGRLIIKRLRKEVLRPHLNSLIPERREVDLSRVNITASWQDELNVKIEEEWMAYVWRVYLRAQTLDGNHYAGMNLLQSTLWTLKQISNPRAPEILRDVEKKIAAEWTLTEDDPCPVPEANFSVLADSRRQSLWYTIEERIFQNLFGLSSVSHDYLKSSSKNGWKVRNIRKREDLKALIFKDPKSMQLQDWVAPIDTYSQLEKMLGPLMFSYYFPRENHPVDEDKVPKSAAVQKEIDKYFGRYTANCPHKDSFAGEGLDWDGKNHMKILKEKVWKAPEFAILSAEYKKFIDRRMASVNNKPKKLERKSLKEEIDQKCLEIQELMASFASTYGLPEKSENAADIFWSKWRTENPEIKDDSDVSEYAEYSDSEDSDISIHSSDSLA